VGRPPPARTRGLRAAGFSSPTEKPLVEAAIAKVGEAVPFLLKEV